MILCVPVSGKNKRSCVDNMLPGEENSEVFLSEVVSSGRVTIPKHVRHKLNISEGDEVRVRLWKEEEDVSEVGTKSRFERR